MLQALLKLASTKPLDVQVWHCNPLVVVNDKGTILYGRATRVEFTPFEENEKVVGHAVAMTEGDDGVRPEVSIAMRQYIDNPLEFGRRQGIILTGTNATGSAVRWLINGAVDRFMTTAGDGELEYDEETAKLLEEELEGEPDKVNLNSY